jgi:hypothetical protein
LDLSTWREGRSLVIRTRDLVIRRRRRRSRILERVHWGEEGVLERRACPIYISEVPISEFRLGREGVKLYQYGEGGSKKVGVWKDRPLHQHGTDLPGTGDLQRGW